MIAAEFMVDCDVENQVAVAAEVDVLASPSMKLTAGSLGFRLAKSSWLDLLAQLKRRVARRGGESFFALVQVKSSDGLRALEGVHGVLERPPGKC